MLEPNPGEHATADGCIGSDELAALMSGNVAPERVEILLTHVDACASCARLVTDLARLDGIAPENKRYEIGRVLGSGAMGIVYDAWDPRLQRRVAVKLVRPERAGEPARARMLREARALARINHPNVIAVYDVREHAGQVVLATELIDGQTINLWQTGRSRDEIVEAWVQVARGLAAAHRAGIVHRDIKPTNVLVGSDGRVRVGDFGLARLADEAPQRPSQLSLSYAAGTPAYMAPEQNHGAADARSDQYAMCVALAEALTRTRPVAGAAITIDGCPHLGAALTRGLSIDPDARFPTMDVFADALTGRPTAAPRRWIGYAIAGGLVAAAIVMMWLARGSDRAWAPFPVEENIAIRALASHLPATVMPRIDGWLAMWSHAAAEVSSETDDGTLRAREERCLIDELAQLDHQIQRWQAGLDLAPMNAHNRTEELPRPTRCSRAAQRSMTDPTSVQLARVSALRLGLTGALESDPEQALPRVRVLFRDARAIGFAPVAVEVALALAELQRESDHDGAEHTLRDALAIADQSAAAVSRIETRIELLSLIGGTSGDEAGRLAEQARALLLQIGGDAELEAKLEYAVGGVFAAHDRSGQAVAAYERALRNFRIAYGPDSMNELMTLLAVATASTSHAEWLAARRAAESLNQRAGFELPIPAAWDDGAAQDQIAGAESNLTIIREQQPNTSVAVDAEINLATILRDADRTEPALDHFRSATALAAKLEMRSSRVAMAHASTAKLLRERGDTSAALTEARRATELARTVGDDVILGLALTEVAEALLAVHRPAASELEQALVAYERGHAPTAARAHTRFVLATVLWTTARSRALDLAHAAHADLEAELAATAERPDARIQRRLAIVESWLADHQN